MVSVEQVPKVEGVLHRERPVQADLVAYLLDEIRRGMLA